MKTFILLLLFVSPLSYAQEYRAVQVGKFEDVVWGFSFISAQEILVTERGGGFYSFNMKTKKKTRLQAPKIVARGQSGLLDVHYRRGPINNYVYFTFTEKYKGMFTTSLARGIYKDKKVSDIKTIFRAQIFGETTRHFGSRIVFKNDKIFMTVGDRGNRKYAQNLSYHNGKVLRLTEEGRPAPGNPYLDNPKALPEIWSLGHRNPQGIDLDPVSKEIYSIEFGPRGGDELNLIGKKKNYGWPVITYGKEYWGPRIGTTHKKGMEQPIVHWVPSISPSGMAFYKGNKLSFWKNNLFVACLAGAHLRRLKILNGKVIEQEKLFSDLNDRIRHVRTGLDGWLYFSTDSGKIYRVEKKK